MIFIPIILLFAAFILFLIAIALLEKRRVLPSFAVHLEEAKDLPAYFSSMSQLAAELNFSSLGIFHKSHHQVYYWYWLSLENDTMAVVSTYKIAGIRTNVTFLASPLQNGKWMITTDDAAMFQRDNSNLMMEVEFVFRAHFNELWDRHRARLELNQHEVKLLSASNLINDWENFERACLERLEEQGLIRFLDAANSTWRYTIKGAIHVISFGFIKVFQKSIKQHERASNKRPGD